MKSAASRVAAGYMLAIATRSLCRFVCWLIAAMVILFWGASAILFAIHGAH